MSLLIIQQGILGTNSFLLARIIFLNKKKFRIIDETISSELENMFSMPYLNLGLNVFLQF